MEITVRHAKPGDYEAMHRIMCGPRAAGTLQLPLQSAEVWRKRLAEPPEGLFMLVACAGEEVVGNLGLETSPNRPRVRHVGSIGMAVRDDWHKAPKSCPSPSAESTRISTGPRAQTRNLLSAPAAGPRASRRSSRPPSRR